MGAPGNESYSSLLRQISVQRARVIVCQNEDEDESIHGTTWGDVQGVQGLTRMRLGSAVTKADLEEDWTMTHELSIWLCLRSLTNRIGWKKESLHMSSRSPELKRINFR